uniref:Putative secreted protein n=1 Tax=Ixodes ricinus TaxID=34613 RepID=A0A6B0V4R8_IXORI
MTACTLNLHLLRLVLVVQVHAVFLRDALPAGFRHAVHPHDSAAGRIPERCVVDGLAGELEGLSVLHVELVAVVEDAERIRRSRTGREHATRETVSLVVHVVQAGSPLVPAGDHNSQGQPHALVVVQDVGEQLGCSCHRDPLSVPQLVDAAAFGQHPLPVDAVRGTSGHGAQEVLVDHNDLLDALRADVLTPGGSRVSRDDDPSLVLEAQRGGALVVVDLDLLPRVVFHQRRHRLVRVGERRLSKLRVTA